MLSRFVPAAASTARAFSTTPATAAKVAVCGAAGGIGQPLSMLLKLTDKIDHLSLYDIQLAKGVAADVSHCNTRGQVTGHVGPDELGDALTGCDIVVIPAGVPRKPGMTRDDLFNVNASIVKGLAEAAAKYCPTAALCIISNPVNSTVPIVAETLKAAGVYDPKKLFGVTTLDVVRANTFVAGNQGWDVAGTNVTVIGGHAGITIVPLLSQLEGASFSDADRDALTHRIQFGGDEVVQAKDGTGSATLSMAHAGARFTTSLLRAFEGEKGIVECSFVDSGVTDLPFFSTRVSLGTDGVSEVHPIGAVSDYEQAYIDKMTPELGASIEKGIAFCKE